MKNNFLQDFIKQKQIYLFIAPGLILLLVFNYYPIFTALYRCMYTWDGVTAKFIGFGNFTRMINDHALRSSVPNVLFLTFFAVGVALTIPLIAAEVVFNLKNERSRYFYRVLFTIPMVVPWMVTLMVWRFIYDPQAGILNQILTGMGLKKFTGVWLGDPKIVLWCLAFIAFPWVAGFNFLIYMAGLENISTEIYDSALIDGATGFIRFLKIDIPLIMGQIKLIFIMTIITQIQAFQNVLVLTKGGPGYSSMVPGYVMYRSAFMYTRMGYASAIGVAIAIFLLGLTIINMKFIKTTIEYES